LHWRMSAEIDRETAGEAAAATREYGRQAGPWIRQATAFPHPGHLKRSLPSRFTTDHGGRSIGTWLISHDGRHVPQDRKASVSSPPTGSSTDGSISTDPGQPQTAPVYRILVRRNRIVAKQRSRRCSAAGSMGRCS